MSAREKLKSGGKRAAATSIEFSEPVFRWITSESKRRGCPKKFVIETAIKAQMATEDAR